MGLCLFHSLIFIRDPAPAINRLREIRTHIQQPAPFAHPCFHWPIDGPISIDVGRLKIPIAPLMPEVLAFLFPDPLRECHFMASIALAEIR